MVQLEHQAPRLMVHTTTQYGRLDTLVNLLGYHLIVTTRRG
jgi:hypothetical protein